MFDFPVSEYVYSSLYGGLKLYIFDKDEQLKNLQPAIIFFHGAGFSTHEVTPSQFQHHANYFSSIGFISICVEYRPRNFKGLFSPIASLKHANYAISWIRANAFRLGIDPSRIVVCGASAGGYLCLCSALIDHFIEMNDRANCKPNALVIFNGGVDSSLLIPMFPEQATELASVSPVDHIREGLPPSIFFHGSDDVNIPLQSVTKFVEKMVTYGNVCELVVYEGLGHGFFNYGNHGNVPYLKTIERMTRFLEERGILK